jgi:PAS domain S-box-containing protein
MTQLDPRLVENERQNLRNLFRQAPEMLCILGGPEHVFESVNEAHIKALGLDATGLPVRQAQPEAKRLHDILDEVYRTGETVVVREAPVHVRGELRYFNLTYAARRDLNGTIDGIMALGVEVTDQVVAQQELKESDSRLKLALASGHMGTWTLELATGELSMSGETARILGLDRLDEGVQKVIDMAVHSEDRPEARRVLEKAIAERAPYRFECRVVDPDGSIRWILSQGNARYGADGAPVTLSGIVMDITDRKQDERALEESVRARDEFLSIASHELRTPLTSLKLQLQLGRRRFKTGEASPDVVDAILQTSLRQAARLEQLVDELLDVSRIKAGGISLSFEELRAGDVIRGVAERYGDELREAGCELTVQGDLDVKVRWDRSRMEQVFMNLLTNAVKYAAGAPISIRAENRGGWYRVSVQDGGPGVPEESRDRIFERYERADAPRSLGGLGLGLYIVRQIVQGHGGNIRVEGEPGTGARFVVEVPC